jgi:uncharacterized protein (DUF2147 family)
MLGSCFPDARDVKTAILTATTVAWLSITAAAAGAAPGDEIVGTWLTEAQDSKVEIAKTATGYAGKVVWLKEPQRNGKPATDLMNTDTALRIRPIMGLEILGGLSYAGDRTWRGGTIYSPRKGRSYAAEATIDKDGRLDIKVKDGILSKQVVWTRAEPP